MAFTNRFGALLRTSFRYLEPRGGGRWVAVSVERDRLLSARFCSGYRLRVDGQVRLLSSRRPP